MKRKYLRLLDKTLSHFKDENSYDDYIFDDVDNSFELCIDERGPKGLSDFIAEENQLKIRAIKKLSCF